MTIDEHRSAAIDGSWLSNIAHVLMLLILAFFEQCECAIPRVQARWRDASACVVVTDLASVHLLG